MSAHVLINITPLSGKRRDLSKSDKLYQLFELGLLYIYDLESEENPDDNCFFHFHRDSIRPLGFH